MRCKKNAIPFDCHGSSETHSSGTDFSKNEILYRLLHALRVDALGSAKPLFISCTDADVVMRTLEMRSGSSRLIADSILGQFRQLPNLIDDISRLVEFATKLQYAVAAIKAVDIDGQGYLQNPLLLERVLHKLPRFMLTNYAHYRPTVSSSKSALERVSDFLIHEAQLNPLTPELGVLT